MTEANSQVDTKVFRLLPKIKAEKSNSWCAALSDYCIMVVVNSTSTQRGNYFGKRN